MARKTRTVKMKFLIKGIKHDYEHVLINTIGDALSLLSCYKNGSNGEAYFDPDCDYEIIIKPKSQKGA